MNIKCKIARRSRFIAMEEMIDSDGKTKPMFEAIYFNMVQNRVTMVFEVTLSCDKWQKTNESRLEKLSNDLDDFCENHCTGLWTRVDPSPKEVGAPRTVLTGEVLSTFEVDMTTFFEKSEDADYFMKNCALIQKLTY